MGDRGNIVVREGSQEIWLYTHWCGSDIADVVQKALQKKWRWDDAPYLTRIIFDTLTEGCYGEETGFGIWTGPCDNEHDILVVDVGQKKVFKYAPHPKTNRCSSIPKKEWTFEQFISNKKAVVS